MAWKTLLQLSVLIGFFTKEIRGNDDMYRCPDHLSRSIYLKTFGEKCYRYEKGELYWTTARSRCTGEGGDLIQIRNQATQNWVMSTLNELHWNKNGVWIGAHDRDDERNWRWVTGERITWSFWGGGQPNCDWLCIEDCGSLRRDDGGRWHDKPCSFSGFTYSFICQYDMKTATTTTTPTTTTPTTTTPTTTTQTTTTPTTTTPTTMMPTTTTTTTTPSPTTTFMPTPEKGEVTVNLTDMKPATTTTTTTNSTTMLPTIMVTNTTITTTVTVYPTGKFAEHKSQMNEGELSGVVVASVLGSISLLTILTVCFFRSRKKKEKANLAMHFDNSTYTVRSKLSSKVRMSRHKRSGNYEVLTGSQSINADQNEGTETKSSNVSVIFKDSGHYSELSENKMVEKLIVYLPNNDNNAYEEYNIATHKVWENESPQFLNECADSKAVYNSVSENEAACNAMNEQLETSKKQYDAYGNVESPDYSNIYYIDMNTAAENGESTVDQYA